MAYTSIATARKAGLSLKEGAFLEALTRQNPRNMVLRGDSGWHVHTSRRWQELAGISDWDYRQVTKSLQDKGIIIIELHKHDNAPTNFIRLYSPGFESFAARKAA